ncbi:MAG TPA: penicillin-binding protein 1C [Thermoanaerobaculia bacterium]|nr:penicillin-binding protein 1C [Thermoanaerobaculia bacterium]
MDLVFPFPWEDLHRPPAVVVEDRMGEPLRFFLPADQRWRFPVRLEDLPPELPRALVASEDRRFWEHPGVDPAAVVRAAWSNLRSGEVVSGASTIPMQIARMAEPGPRTLPSKIRESFRALQLERRYSKEELLEIYLNLTPYGGNVEGVGAAAWFYFGKDPDQLSLGEIALLTALPRSPVRYDPTIHPKAAFEAKNRVLRQLAQRGAFETQEIGDALRQPVPESRRRPVFAAPHFTELVARQVRSEPRIRTSLDRRVQDVVHEQVRGRIGGLRDEGIGNAAVVVIENDTRAVRAFVGSAGFLETYFDGQVNGAMARRSPGSTLKPFLYALAMDTGRVIPATYLLDVPTDFSGYVAENYDERYRGRVTVREALILSLNACAVRLLSDVGLADFHKLLLRGGLGTLDKGPEHYGLPLVLGAGEVTLLDLTNLYASLAEGGVHRPVRMLETDGPASRTVEPETSSNRLMSPESARVITQILTDVRRPDFPEAWDLTQGAPAVAWKTGTSYGHRDAWAVGFSRRYTIGVWVGNFDGRPKKGIAGSQHAGPLLFDLFRAIEPGGDGPGKPEGLRLDTIEVCAGSHELPGPFCPKRMRVTYLPGRTKLSSCALHQRVLVDAETGDLLASGDCLGKRPHEFRLLEVFPPELVAWWRSQGMMVASLPRVSPACQGIPAGEPPRIVSPDSTTAYRLRRDAPAEYQRIPLVAQASPGANHLFWYQDGLLVATTATTSAEPRFLSPVLGEHRLVVTDDLGRTAGITYRVE